MIGKISYAQPNTGFGAKVNLDLACKDYYRTSPAFRETIEIIKKSVTPDVDVFVGNSIKSGNKIVYGKSIHSDGKSYNVKIGEFEPDTYGRVSLDKFISDFDGASSAANPAEHFMYTLEKSVPKA